MKYILLLVVICSACTSSKNNKDLQKESFEQVISEKFEGNVTLMYNNNKNFVICKEYVDPKALPNYKAKKFMIYDIEKGMTVYEDNFVNGSVAWISDKKIKIIKGLGTMTAEHPDGYIAYIYDTEKGTRTEEPSSTK